MSPPALSVLDLERSFGSRTALAGVSFTVEPGERLAVIGPNGAGKTTLLSMLAGVLAPSAGRVVHGDGRPSGWVPQQPAVYGKLSVAENLRLFARLERLPDPDAAVERMLALTGLSERACEQVSRLSGGNRQRLNIAVGLLADPSVLLLDEPSASLDPRQRERLWRFILGLADRGTSVVYSTHDVLEAESYGDRVLVLADGEPLFLGTAAELERDVASSSTPPSLVPAGRPGFESAFVAFLARRGH